MSTIYIRSLKRAEHTVFCVADGQKFYYDPQFNRRIPYSSGQQVKRSLIDSLSKALNEAPSPTTFLFDVNKKDEMKEGEVYATCNPTYADQLFGGWMKAAKGGKLVVCPIVYSELSPQFENQVSLDTFLKETGIEVLPFTRDILWKGGKAWKDYILRGGKRKNRIIPDFLIGAFSSVKADAIITRDKGFYKKYFHIDPYYE